MPLPLCSSVMRFPSMGTGFAAACAEPKKDGSCTENVCAGRYSMCCRRTKRIMYKHTATAKTDSNSIQPRMESLPQRMVDHLPWPGGDVLADADADPCGLFRLCDGVLVEEDMRVG